MMTSPIQVDIELPDDSSPPAIAYPKGCFPTDPLFVVVVPPGASEEDAKLFALCLRSANSKAKPRKTTREPATADEWYLVDPLDPEQIPRLFERGLHPGDFRIVGSQNADRPNQERRAKLIFFDLSQGAPHKLRISTAIEIRKAIAEASEAIGTKAWKQAAEIFDPGSLLRNGVVVLPDQEARSFDGDRSMDVENHPLPDFRLLTTPDLLDEIGREARSVLYGCPDIPANGPVALFLKRDIDAFLDVFRRRKNDYEAAYTALSDAMSRLLDATKGEPGLRRLQEGRGPGSVCWRNLFAPTGLIGILISRVRNPKLKADAAEAASRLPDWAKAALINPNELLLRRPASLEEVEYALSMLKPPFLALKPNRMAASPGLRHILEQIDEDDLNHMLQNNLTLVQAFDEIENNTQRRDEARDAVAIGWHAIATAVVARNPNEVSRVRLDAPNFVTEAASSRPFLQMRDPGPSPSPFQN